MPAGRAGLWMQTSRLCNYLPEFDAVRRSKLDFVFFFFKKARLAGARVQIRVLNCWRRNKKKKKNIKKERKLRVKSSEYVFFMHIIFHRRNYFFFFFFNPVHIVSVCAHPLRSPAEKVVPRNRDRCERNEIICLFKWWQRTVAWGYPGGGVLCDQTSNGISLIKKEIESGPLNEQRYSGTPTHRWVDSDFKF